MIVLASMTAARRPTTFVKYFFSAIALMGQLGSHHLSLSALSRRQWKPL
ncbi:unnamed protein product [Protopolystoma xenopodis]|uniref:Uncharacterized protein n=1 Tax=Protopolystoma xenopodis TaxID=117903 RepID=A0A448X6Z9_9PLAT|nr:unnamed protein product [Protopolystoma xenopodis]